jgi:hypothetical protein
MGAHIQRFKRPWPHDAKEFSGGPAQIAGSIFIFYFPVSFFCPIFLLNFEIFGEVKKINSNGSKF